MGNNKMIKTAAAVALGASVVATAVAPGAASAATTYKLKSGKLVNAKTGKVVKGYKVYKSTLYKDGKKAKGYVTSGKVLYKDGKKFTGLRSAKYYKAGKVATGTYKGVYYKTGKKFTGLKSGVYYKAGVKGTGSYKSVYYKNGKKHTGLVGATYYKAGKKGTGSYKGIQYKSGKAVTGVVNDVYYNNGVKATAVVDGVQYFDGAVANGTFHSKLYVDGKVFEGTKEGKLYVAGKVFSGVNAADQKVYVDGVLDETVPAITVAGKQTVAYGASIDEASFVTSVKDNSGEEIKAVVTSNKIDTTKPGNYTVTYTATDKNGNVGKASVEVTVQAPAVESVKAINASEIKVTFKQDVDEESAIDPDNYELKVNNEPTYRAISSIVLDGKTATLRLDPTVAGNTFQSGDKYVLQTNNKIKTDKDAPLAQFVSAETAFEQSAAPSLNKVVKSGNNLELTFDRPVKSSTALDVTLIKVDGIALASKDLTPAYTDDAIAGSYTYTIALDNDALAEAKKVGTHEVTLYDVSETANAYAKVASVLTGNFVVTDAVVTPEVTGVEAVNANRLFLYTNTVVTLGTDAKVTVTKGNYEFKLDTATKYDDVIVDDTNLVDAVPGFYDNKPGVWVTIADASATEENPLYKTTETSATLNVTLENYTADGLVGKKSTQTVTLNKNNKKPAIIASKNSIDNGTLKVVFDNALGKPAVADAATPLTSLAATDIVVRDKDGVIVATTGALVAGNVVTINGLAKVTDAPYTVEFKKDTFRNLEVNNKVSTFLVNTVKNDELTTTVGSQSVNFEYTPFALNSEITSGTPAAEGEYIVDTTAKKATITFSYGQDMDDSARDVANYTLDGKALPAGSKVDFVGDKKVVRVTLPEGALSQSTKYKFGIKTSVKTAKGSKIVDSLQTKNPVELVVELDDTVQPKLASAIYYVGVETVVPGTTTNKLEVTFNEKLAAALTSASGAITNANDDFKVVINGSEVKVTSVEKVTSGDNQDRKLLLTLGQQVNVAQAATVSIVGEDAQADGNAVIEDLKANKAEANSSATASTYKYNAALAASIQTAADLASANAAIANVKSALSTANNALVLAVGTTESDATVKLALETAYPNVDFTVTGSTGSYTVKINKTVNGQDGTEETITLAVTVAQ